MVDISQLRSFYQIIGVSRTLFLLFILGGCATVPRAEDGKKGANPKDRTHYTFVSGQPVEFEDPFPTLRQVQVEWHFRDGSKLTAPGFRTWDVNRDGITEMVEVLDDEGRVSKYLFDFNQDGIVDWEKTPGEKGHLSLELN